MQDLKDKLTQTPVFYITRDIERALALDTAIPDYFIISNYSKSFKPVDNKNILLIKEKEPLDTWQLLKNKKVQNFLNDYKNPNILVFKPTKQIERICTDNNWNLLNPSAELSNKIEEKISQLDWLGSLKKYLPNYSVKLCRNIEWKKEKFILQFNRSHTGSGTILIESNKQLEKIKNKFPEREARLAKYIEGPLFTNNNIVTKNKTLIGNINYQITGLQPFTDLPFATIGNDWGFPDKYLDKEQAKQYKKIVTEIGEKLRTDGWKGLFGVDIVIEESTGKLYLVEINARQPASTTYESQLQQSQNTKHRTHITTFEAHLASLLDIDLSNYNLIEIKNGAQIIARNTYHVTHITPDTIDRLKKENFILTKYNNIKPGSDLLRIQSKGSIIKDHDEFNELGKKILEKI